MIVDIDREIVLDGSVESRGRGRPPKNGGRYERVHLRISKSERERLEALAAKNGKSMVDIVVEALDLYEKWCKAWE